MARKRVSTDENDRLLLVDATRLLEASEPLAKVTARPDGLEALALGAVLLGRELLEGVKSESAISPPRALNAHRLARHLWELEVELHYAHENPDVRLEQMVARDAMNHLGIHRSRPKKRRGKMHPEKERIFKWHERKAKPKDDDARRRRCDGEEVPADEWGSVPDRLTVARALGRKDEYHTYYGVGSLYSHPSVTAIDLSMILGDAGITRRNEADSSAPDLASMALSLARTSFSRLLYRAATILEDQASGLADEVKAYMDAAGIAETGVVGR